MIRMMHSCASPSLSSILEKNPSKAFWIIRASSETLLRISSSRTRPWVAHLPCELRSLRGSTYSIESKTKPILIKVWKHSLIESIMLRRARLFRSRATEDGSVLHECGDEMRKSTIVEKSESEMALSSLSLKGM